MESPDENSSYLLRVSGKSSLPEDSMSFPRKNPERKNLEAETRKVTRDLEYEEKRDVAMD